MGRLRRAPHGIDFGPLEPCLPRRLSTEGRRLRLAPQAFVSDLDRLEKAIVAARPATVLVGRRDLRSNNSWLHNSERLVKGPERCTLLMHPADAVERRLCDGQRVRVSSAAGAVEVPLQVSSFDREFHEQHIAVQALPFATLKTNYGMINGRGYPDTVDIRTDLFPKPAENGGKVSQPISSKVEATASGVTLFIAGQHVRRILNVADAAFLLEDGTVTLAGSGPGVLHSEYLQQILFGVRAKDQAPSPS